jgi:glycosyltransferase involved in cell wall biosynthesis
MSNNFLVSVCCSTFNHEKFIGHALDGFLMQKTNFAVEFLINDDCSQDKTPEILKEYENRFPGVFNVTYQTENQFSKGLKPFTHLLFPKVNGKYIALCEGDDYWTDPLKLQKQVDFLTGNEDYSMCFHRCKIVDENNNELESDFFKHLKEKDFSGEEILEKWSIPTASVMFRSVFRNQITERAKNPGYYFGDTPMFLTLLECGKAHCLQDCMSVYRVHKGGISKDTSPKKFIRWYNDHKTIKSDFTGKYKNVTKKNIANIAFGASVNLTKQGYLCYGIKFFLLSLFYDRKPFESFVNRKLKTLWKILNIPSKNRKL